VRALNLDTNLHTFHSPKFRSVVNDGLKFFIETPLHLLPPSTQFIGAGVYALYYKGDYRLYSKIAKLNRRDGVQPIYVGKAVPPGWRTGRALSSNTRDLYGRLAQHARSIQQTSDLKAEHFHCRFMILSGAESDLVVPIEAALIRQYKPLWNTVVDGFGNHDPGKGRYNQARSEWDILHPGRTWVARLTGESALLEDLVAKVKRSLK
jgi:hypothetical protein